MCPCSNSMTGSVQPISLCSSSTHSPMVSFSHSVVINFMKISSRSMLISTTQLAHPSPPRSPYMSCLGMPCAPSDLHSIPDIDFWWLLMVSSVALENTSGYCALLRSTASAMYLQPGGLTLVGGLFDIRTPPPTRDVHGPLLASRAATNNPRTAWERPRRAQSTWRMTYYCTYLREKKRAKNLQNV